jgi:uncharacterized protein YbjT (DUF2867 family)
MKKILIAGASGFIGSALIERLLQQDDIQITALSRGERTSDHPQLIWKQCDLFSLKDINLAMEGCEEAYYLVHSMLPSASLTQGKFYDFDLIMADNFIRASASHNLKHIIYLGGLIPSGVELSWHLRSRFEVEQTFRHSTIKTTVIRAALIIGPQGSSFTILQRLIERLPIMICPAWTKTKSQPVGVNDVINVLERCLLDEKVQGGIYDISGPEVITYQGLIRKTSAKIKKNTSLLTLNIIPLTLSRFWVSLITGVPKDLVYPLVLSLKYEMLPSVSHKWPYQKDLETSLDDCIEYAIHSGKKTKFKGHRSDEKDVRSIQRLVLPPGRDAEWVANEYFNWLPTFFSTLVRVNIQDDRCSFYIFNPSISILILKKSHERSSSERQLLYVVGGLLSGVMKRGRLEFREVLDRQYIMAALHEFRPALPWYVYRWTQALVHLIVMKAFGEHLKWHVISQKRYSE